MRINRPSVLLTEIQRGLKIELFVDGNSIEAYDGESVAAALLSAGINTFQLSHKHKQPRSLYCGMGICYECLVTINGVLAQRACITPVEEGMRIETCKELLL